MDKTHKTIPFLDKMSPNDKARFWVKIDIKSEEECWPWKEAVNDDGYGKFSITHDQREYKLFAHRVAKTLSMGKEIEEGKLVLHACDNPPCCNPSHLFVADHQTNMDDMVSKNRSPLSFTGAKTNWDTVDQIRNSQLSVQRLSEESGLSVKAIRDIKNHRSWKEDHRQIAAMPSDVNVFSLDTDDDDCIKYILE